MENITKSNVIVCVRPDNKLNYCFPILESEKEKIIIIGQNGVNISIIKIFNISYLNKLKISI